MRCILILLALALLVGCARFEHQVVAPQEVAGRVGRQDYSFELDALEYRLRTVDNRLVMRIFNHTEENITLLGARSTAVDPDGQSHPFHTQTIAPNSFIRLILPPPRPRVYRAGPSIGVGVGTRIGARRGHAGHAFVHDPWLHRPHYLAVYDAQSIHWDWRGEGQVRLNLVYTRDDPDPQRPTTFSHHFILQRVRAR